MKILKSFVIGLSLLLGQGCTEETPDQNQITVKEAAKPAIWRVSGDAAKGVSGSAYLFGTIHLLPVNTNWQTPTVTRAIANSDRLIIEVTGLDDVQNVANIFAKRGLSPDLPPLVERVPPSLRPKLSDTISKSNLPAFALDRMESWAAALTIASTLSQSLDLKQDEGVEKKLSAQFEAAKKPISGLETVDQQFGYFDTLHESDQRRLLENIIRDSDEVKPAFEKLLNAWISGDVEALAQSASEGMMEAEDIRQALLVKRNENWAVELEKMLNAEGTLFVAVGAAHLAGTDSVQTMLEKAGMKVERLQ